MIGTISRVEVTGIECPFCLQRIFSSYRHDFRRCNCEYCFVGDGGTDYLRYGWGVYYGEDKAAKEKTDLVNLLGPPKLVKISAYKRLVPGLSPEAMWEMYRGAYEYSK